MAELGGIFEVDDAASGPDLRHQVTVPRRRLGQSKGCLVPLPMTFDVNGQKISRYAHPEDPQGYVRVHLPANLPDGTWLRLRNQGGVQANRCPGDLYLQISIRNERRWPWFVGFGLTMFALALVYGLR